MNEAEDAISRSWERWGEPNHIEIGRICSEAHLNLVEAMKKQLNKRRREFIKEAEYLLEHSWECHYNIKDSYLKALSYTKLANG